MMRFKILKRRKEISMKIAIVTSLGIKNSKAISESISNYLKKENVLVEEFEIDTITESMQKAISETQRRREIQDKFNKEHGIIPKTIIKEIKNTLEITKKVKQDKKLDKKDISQEIERLRGLMNIASKQLDFETAIKLRDEMIKLKKLCQN